MKLCLLAEKHTAELFSWLDANFGTKHDIQIVFPTEDISRTGADILIMEREIPLDFSQNALNMNQIPIVIPKAGISRKNIHYMADFSKEFPAFLTGISSKEPKLRLQSENERYFYRQQDVVMLKREGGLQIYLASGKKVFSKTGYTTALKQLSPLQFVSVTPHITVNLFYLSRLEEDALCLQNGMRISFPKENFKKIENALFKANFHRNHP